MEAFFLLFTIASNLIASSFLSLLLLLNRLLLRRPSYAAVASDASASVLFYEGTVWHERQRPVRHSFRYPVKYALLDLDDASRVPNGHLSAEEARRFASTDGRVLLLTIPPSVGYEQNPLSLYYCYNLKCGTQHLEKCIAEALELSLSLGRVYEDLYYAIERLRSSICVDVAFKDYGPQYCVDVAFKESCCDGIEVTNTPWGERVLFAFNPNSDTVAKPLHVSPFMDMLGNWIIKANSPGDNLSVYISVQHPELGNYFTATLNIKRVSPSSPQDQDMFFWLMPQKVAVWIYWHALQLWWKNVAFIQHPRYTNPSYREDACSRDYNLQCPGVITQNESSHPAADSRDLASKSNQNSGCHSFFWRDAKWPWS